MRRRPDRCCHERARATRPSDSGDARLRRRNRQRGPRHQSRAPRGPASTSEIIVETADPRLEDLTVDYRDIVDDTRSRGHLLIHHFSLGSRASRTAFALPCRMMLVYHNITPPEYFLGVHDQLVRQCYHGRRELLPYRSRCDLALGDSEFNRQELETLGFPPHGRAARRTRLHASRRPTGRPRPRRVRRRVDEHSVRRPGHSQQASRQPHPVLPRLQDPLRTARAACCSPARTAASTSYLAQLHALVAALGVDDVHDPGTGQQCRADGPLRRRRPVPVRERARGILRAASSRPSTSACRSSHSPPRPSRRRWTAAGCSTPRPTRVRWRPSCRRILTDGPATDAVIERQDRALERLRARDFAGLVAGYVRQALDGPRLPPPHVTPDFWRQFKLAEELEAIRQSRPAAFRALPLSPEEAARPIADLGHRE